MKAVFMLMISLAPTMLQAAEVGDLITFTAGTPAKAAEVNKNFSDVKTAVNENYQRLVTEETKSTTQATQITDLQTSNTTNSAAITTLQSNMNGKQAVLSNSCAVGSAIRAIDSAGVVTCEPIIKAGKLIVQPLEFRGSNVATEVGGYCTSSMGDYAQLRGTNSSCLMDAPLHFPNGVTVNNFQCYIYMDTSEPSLRILVSLERNPLNGGSNQFVANGTTVGIPLGYQTTVLTSALTNNIVDNNQYYYRARAQFVVTGVTLNAIGFGSVKLFNCTADYAIP